MVSSSTFTGRVFSSIGKWLGMQDVTVGYPQFDEDFIIKGNDEPKLRRFFGNEKIRAFGKRTAA